MCIEIGKQMEKKKRKNGYVQKNKSKNACYYMYVQYIHSQSTSIQSCCVCSLTYFSVEEVRKRTIDRYFVYQLGGKNKVFLVGGIFMQGFLCILVTIF